MWWGVEGVCGVCTSVVCEYVRGGVGGCHDVALSLRKMIIDSLVIVHYSTITK